MASGYSDLSEICKDNRAYGLHQKPPKINLLNEKPRRESVIEQQLTSTIIRPKFGGQQQANLNQQQVSGQRSHEFSANYPYNYSDSSSINGNYTASTNVSILQDPIPGTSGTGHSGIYHYPSIKTVRTTIKTTTTSSPLSPPQLHHQQQQQKTVSSYSSSTNEFSDLTAELNQKEAKLKREIAYMNQHQNQWSRPRQVREPRREPQSKRVQNEQKWVKECPSAPPSRPTSRASSTRSTTEADLLEKAAKLLQDVEELEKKPLKTQQILIEGGAKNATRPTSSNMGGSDISSLHTAIIEVPTTEVNNKSPLPFAFDNFSTLGVRGNIASVGATEPETPYPPIFPMIKRTPSPANRHY